MVDNDKMLIIKDKIDILFTDFTKNNINLVIESVFNLILNYNISEEEIKKFKISKFEERGGFSQGIFCYLFLIDKKSSDALYYKEKKEYKLIEMIKNVYSDDYIGYSCNKLIRDRIPEIAINKNQFLFYRYLNSMELKDELCKKIMEEYQELIQAKTREEIVEETADLLEVLDHLYRLIH